jgi:hypothetical protein
VIAFNVLHALNGRIRIEIPTVKGSPETAQELENRLGTDAGISSAVANPATGTVLVHYDPTQIEPVVILQRLGLAEEAARDAMRRFGPLNANYGMRSRLAETLMAEFLEVAVVGLVGALA